MAKTSVVAPGGSSPTLHRPREPKDMFDTSLAPARQQSASAEREDDPAAQGTVNVHINKRHKPKDGTNRGKALRSSEES